MRRWSVLAVSGLAFAGFGLLGGCGQASRHRPAGGALITVSSAAFPAGGSIPVRYSCNGDNVSPPLAWSGLPAGTAEVAVVVDDPDAPRGAFYHWIVAGLAPSTTALAEGTHAGITATGSSGQPGYTGMCPPAGQRHRYRFTVYALQTPSGVTAGMDPVSARKRIVAAERAAGQLIASFGS